MIVRALAPAKINLGLEVIRRREDGYHDICTVMVAISVFDRLSVAPAAISAFTTDEPCLAGEDNLAARAAALLGSQPGIGPAHIHLRKRIPLASGLGGASSDAAASLLALRAAFRLPILDTRLAELGAGLGSDVPFFFAGGAALVEGRGELVTSLPPPRDLFAVVVVPDVTIPAKTTTLYQALLTRDFSSGERVRSNAEARTPNDRYLGNAFARSLYERVPDLRAIPDLLRAAGADMAALSGAGPSHYALCADLERAHTIARAARSRIGRRGRVFVARGLDSGAILDERGGEVIDLAHG